MGTVALPPVFPTLETFEEYDARHRTEDYILEKLKAEDNAAPSVDATLAERGSRYGPFNGHSRITWELKYAMQSAKTWETLPVDMKEALHMIAHKIGRILNGDPTYADNWHDIAGYAQLVEKELEQ
jgi:hypothetical protein